MWASTYLQNNRQLLQAFEDTQSKLIRLKIAEAIEEYRIELGQMENEFFGLHKMLENRSHEINKIVIVNLRQLERLQNFLKELKTHVDQLTGMKQTDHNLILFILQRKYKFKRILRRHLADYARLSW